MLFVHLLVQQNHREEVRLVILLLIQIVSNAYDQCATNYLHAVTETPNLENEIYLTTHLMKW